MRKLEVRVPRGCGGDVARIARERGGSEIFVQEAREGERLYDVVTIHCGNAGLEELLAALEEEPDLHVSFDPRGVLALRPPASEAPDQALDVEPRSPIEVFLSGLQSIGSWPAFLGYAAAAGVVVWIGLFTETIYLLTAAMLIAPFASPAMNAALGTARGDLQLFRRSLLRYFAALGVSILVAFLLSLAVRQEIATGLMIDRSFIPSVAVLLPLVAGAAGALNLCQSERSSLVSGAATGMLVAASLAPPAGLIGMSAAIGEWQMALSGAFLLLLQIAGINFAGAVVFRLYGVSPTGARYDRGKAGTSWGLWAASLAALGALVAVQLSSSPDLQRSTRAQRATQDAREVIRASGLAHAVQVQAEFTRGDVPGQNTLLVTAYVQSDGADRNAVRTRLEEAIGRELRANYDAVPLVDLTVLAP
jgi:uncharacterized hydrophobic protein (TIGR00271 family)